ncbi:hypothetical protein DL766_005389 [Monosporascus sp. MC13-8B]|uniref:Conidiation-specific protein 6 n=1 Tax=Monosporascus cannonballus TaxID=155416 RepID=A0ABY0H955_9PEZI|nr:hypothetical protein DL763_010845 [Monosporascus cannonballus]RYO87271.1 hypothetical protein DL762_004316 [Monosporascus cannonballus]RYP29431.1 hypothetical protein DL766_005389 [Monosporascus sp. MC13-8B]
MLEKTTKKPGEGPASNVPTGDEEGRDQTGAVSHASSYGAKTFSENRGGKRDGGGGNEKKNKNAEQGGDRVETLREKAAKKMHGPGANPSQLGDPISLKNETSDRNPTNDERGAAGRKASKL